MANTTIQLKKSGVSGNVPSSLDHGELAINFYDGKLYYKNADNVITYISSGISTNSFATVNANSSLILASSNNDTLSFAAGNNITISACTSTKTITINAQDADVDQFARNTGNSALTLAQDAYNYANTISGGAAIDNVARTLAQSAYDKANLSITFAQSAYDQSNVSIGVDATQNTRLNSIETVNNNQNTSISIMQGVDLAQNNNITSVNQFAQSAYNSANSKLSLSGGTITGDVTANNLTANSTIHTPVIYSAAGGASIEMSDIGIIGINPSGGSGAGIKLVGKTIEGNKFYGGSYAGNYLSVENETKLTSNRYDVVKIVTGTDGNEQNTWNFSNNHLIFPDGTYQNTAYNGISSDSYARDTANGANGLASGAFNSANTNANAITIIQGVDATQNTNITTANNAAWAAYAAGNTNATNITSVNNYAVSAYNKANGAVQTGFTTISANGTSSTPSSNADTFTITSAAANGINILNPSSKTIDFGLRTTGVTAGSYTSTNITVDSFGRVTSATSNTSGGGGSGATITDDATNNITLYPIMSLSTSGSLSLANTSSSKLTYNPSTGTLTTVDLNTTSDVKFKENVETIQSPLDIINIINGVSFNWKDSGNKSYGVIAQELQKVLPELVTQGDKGLSVSYLPLIAILIEAVKEQQKQIDELKKQ